MELFYHKDCPEDLSYPVLSLLQRMFIPFLFNDQTHLCLPLSFTGTSQKTACFFTKPSSHSSSLTPNSVVRKHSTTASRHTKASKAADTWLYYSHPNNRMYMKGRVIKKKYTHLNSRKMNKHNSLCQWLIKS